MSVVKLFLGDGVPEEFRPLVSHQLDPLTVRLRGEVIGHLQGVVQLGLEEDGARVASVGHVQLVENHWGNQDAGPTAYPVGGKYILDKTKS